ncbi:MAG: hypothetical protein ABI718_14820, partial [Acidobacteriota bacterium]
LAHRGFADVPRQLFRGKLGGVDANDDKFIGKPLAEPAQLRGIMVAVDSAECPELQQDHLAPQ